MLNMQGQTFLISTTALRNAIKLGRDIVINPTPLLHNMNTYSTNTMSKILRRRRTLMALPRVRKWTIVSDLGRSSKAWQSTALFQLDLTHLSLTSTPCSWYLIQKGRFEVHKTFWGTEWIEVRKDACSICTKRCLMRLHQTVAVTAKLGGVRIQACWRMSHCLDIKVMKCRRLAANRMTTQVSQLVVSIKLKSTNQTHPSDVLFASIASDLEAEVFKGPDVLQIMSLRKPT